MTKLYLSLIGSLLNLFAYGAAIQTQSSLEYPLKILKHQIVGQIPIEGFIDLRDMLGDKETNMTVWKDDKEDNTYSVVDDGAVSRYALLGDTLFLCERQTPQTRAIYKLQEARLVLPLSIGTKTNGAINGNEQYVDKIELGFEGEYSTSISRSKDVILPDGTHCKNVCMMKTARTIHYSHLPSDSIVNLPVMEEECLWFLPEDKIPLLHSYLIKDVPGSYQAYYYETEQPRDFTKHAVATNDSLSFDGDKKQEASLLQNLEMKNDGEARNVTLNFSALKDMEISIVMASSGGVVYQVKRYKAKANEPISYSYNYSRLPHGEYAIRMDIGGQPKVIKFTVK